MSYSHNQKFTYMFLPNATTNLSAILEVDSSYKIKSIKAKYEKHAGNLY